MSNFDRLYRAIRMSMGAVLLFFLPAATYAQRQPADTCQSATQVDVKDLVHRWIHKDRAPASKSEKKLQIVVVPAGGYSSNTGLAAAVATNMVYTLPGAGKESSALTSLTYTQYQQTILPFQVSVWTKNDRFNIVIDDRYINYPSSLYGLAGKPNMDSGYTVNFSWMKLHQSLLVRIRPNMYLGVGVYYDYYWHIKEVSTNAILPPPNARVALSSAFEEYTGKKVPDDEEEAFGPAFKFLYDSRDNPVNPRSGWYGAILYHPSFKSWGSDANCAQLIVDARKFISLTDNKYNVLAFWAYYWSNFGKTPFLMLSSTGWDDLWNTGRGYSQGRYRGPQMRYFETEYRFQLSRNGLLGGVLFANIQDFPNDIFTSFSDYYSLSQAHVTAVGYGLGVRCKLNKCSRTNLALDMGFGQDFPKPWFAVNLGEVF